MAAAAMQTSRICLAPGELSARRHSPGRRSVPTPASTSRDCAGKSNDRGRPTQTRRRRRRAITNALDLVADGFTPRRSLGGRQSTRLPASRRRPAPSPRSGTSTECDVAGDVPLHRLLTRCMRPTQGGRPARLCRQSPRPPLSRRAGLGGVGHDPSPSRAALLPQMGASGDERGVMEFAPRDPDVLQLHEDADTLQLGPTWPIAPESV